MKQQATPPTAIPTINPVEKLPLWDVAGVEAEAVLLVLDELILEVSELAFD